MRRQPTGARPGEVRPGGVRKVAAPPEPARQPVGVRPPSSGVLLPSREWPVICAFLVAVGIGAGGWLGVLICVAAVLAGGVYVVRLWRWWAETGAGLGFRWWHR